MFSSFTIPCIFYHIVIYVSFVIVCIGCLWYSFIERGGFICSCWEMTRYSVWKNQIYFWDFGTLLLISFCRKYTVFHQGIYSCMKWSWLIQIVTYWWFPLLWSTQKISQIRRSTVAKVDQPGLHFLLILFWGCLGLGLMKTSFPYVQMRPIYCVVAIQSCLETYCLCLKLAFLKSLSLS